MIKLIAILTLFLTTTASAGLLFEPYASYVKLNESGSATQNGSKVKLDDNSLAGPVLGAKAGYGFGDYALGVDYFATLSAGDDDTVKLTNLGAFGMFAFGIVRFWGTYVFSSSYESHD